MFSHQQKKTITKNKKRIELYDTQHKRDDKQAYTQNKDVMIH